MIKCYHIIEETMYFKTKKVITKELNYFSNKEQAKKEFNKLKKINEECNKLRLIKAKETKNNALLYTKDIVLVKVDLSLLGKGNVIEIIKGD